MRGHTTQLCGSPLKAICAIILVMGAVIAFRTQLLGESVPEASDVDDVGEVTLSDIVSDAIVVGADFAQEWSRDGERVTLLRGRCRVRQGDTTMRSRQMVIWRTKSTGANGTVEHVDVYLEDEVRIDSTGRSDHASRRLVSLRSREGTTFEVTPTTAEAEAADDPLFRRARTQRGAALRTSLEPTELVVPNSGQAGPELRMVQLQPQQPQLRRIRLFPRSAVPYNVVSFESPNTTPPEQVWVITGGVVLLVEGVERFDTVDLAADRVVIWTRPDEQGDLANERVQSSEVPFQVYLEGNIVIRQGKNVLRASRGFYDAQTEQALMHDAELTAFVPEANGNIRVRAERLRQLSSESFHAQNAYTTTSEYGEPGYRLQSSDVFLDYRMTDPWLRFGNASRDPLTGQALTESVPWLTTLNNTFLVENVPLFYYPYASFPAEEPGIPLRRLTVRNDRIFGFQIRSTWDMFKLAGIEKPSGIKWDLLADYMSERGPGIGTQGSYVGTDLGGLPGVSRGEGLLYYTHDKGFDNLGRDRRKVPFKSPDRLRATFRHQQRLPDQALILGEFGYLSDRNYLEQYWERDYDNDKDVETLLYAKKNYDNAALSTLARPQLNDFWNTTQWLRADGYVLSEPLFDGLLNWSTHTYGGYADLSPSDPPFSPLEAYTPIPYMPDVEGGILMTRHQLDMPLNLGPVKLVPYVMGEGAYFGEGMTGNAIDRYLYSAGVKSSLMVWRPYPWVQSRIFGLNGLAHKMVFEAGYSVTDSSRGLNEVPQYNEFDDIAQNHFRERIPTTTFDGTLPPTFDPRFYAVRSGTGLNVTSPYHELVADQQVVNLAWRHRLQTKVGPPDRLRIQDWMTLDLEASYFPNENRDNFGKDFGLVGGRYRWNVGKRTSILASSRYDFFDDGQELWSLGVLNQRSTRGSVYLGLRQVKGATLDSQIATASYTYRLSPKWVSTFATQYDIAANRNLSQSMTITRLGADFMFNLGLNYNQNTDNAGIAFMIAPRFGPFANATNNLSSLATSMRGSGR